MALAILSPNIKTLQAFDPLRKLSQSQLSRLAQSVEIEHAPAGRRIFHKGKVSGFGLFLIDGWLRVKSADGRVKDVKSGDASAAGPIAQDLPGECDVIAVTPVRFLRITNALLRDVQLRKGTDQVPDRVAGRQETDESSWLIDEISGKLQQDLENDRLRLPSLPEVAARIGQALNDDVSDAEAIAEIIQVDPAIAVKVIKAANSAVYGRCTPVETCAAAVVRLGTGITHKLVVSFAMKELFNTDSTLLRQRMWDLWQHSTRIASICHVLAQHDDRFNPEQAMLTGLLHDVGVIAIINYLDTLPEPVGDAAVIDGVIAALRGEMSGAILRKWDFPMEFVVAAQESDEWMRESSQPPEPDYGDLVVLAQLHSLAGSEEASSVPAIDETPAYSRLNPGELSDSNGLLVLDQAADQLTHVASLLNI